MARHRQSRRQPRRPAAASAGASLHVRDRRLRCERLEDRRLLAVVTVDTALDVIDFNDGKTSLREAIFATNLVAGADEIRFDFGHDGPATILLTRGELKISDSLTISGPGAELLAIDASGNDPTPNENNGDGSRVFNVDDGNAATLAEVTLQGLTLTGADVYGSLVGGAIVNSERLTVIRNVLTGNAASRGGAIYSGLTHSTFLRVSDSQVSDNSGKFEGGGIYAVADTFLDDTTVSSNSAGLGGGVYVHTRLFATNCIITGNSTFNRGNGGGTHQRGGSLVNCVITENTARHGAGIYNDNRALSIQGCLITSNTSSFFGEGGGVHSRGELSVFDSVVEANMSSFGGGIYASQAQIDNSRISGNGADEGGGINVRGMLVMTRSTVSGNTAGFASSRDSGTGGGISVYGGRIDSSSIINNSAGRGGGLYGIGIIITNSTISENTANLAAGIEGSSLSISHSTIVNNYASAKVGSVFAGGVRVDNTSVLDHVIVAGNFGASGVPADVFGTTQLRFSLIGTSENSNLVEAPIGAPDANGNLIGGPVHGVIDPLLGPLADNCGPTLTHALLPGSPAIDAGEPGLKPGVGDTPQFDQRGAPFSRVVGARIDIGAIEQEGVPFVVDTLVDESDGDYRRGDLSLREAIELANTQPGADEIQFAPDLYAAGPATILLTHGELKITDSLTITGPGAELLTIDASGNDPTPFVNNRDGDRLFNIPGIAASEIELAIAGMTLTGGDPADDPGGAIYSPSSATLVRVIDSVISDNAAFYGGGIYGNFLAIVRTKMLRNHAASGGAIVGGEIEIIDSQFADNRAVGSGGAIYYGGSASVRNSEFVRNYAGGDGGAINAFGSLTVQGCTFRANEGVDRGGAINHSGSALLVSSTVIEDNVSSEVPNTIVGVGAKRGGEGGGIYSGFSYRIEIHSSQISGNRVTGTGGGVWLSGSDVVVDQSIINNNFAARDAGGLYLSSGDVLISNSTISGNRASQSGGGILNKITRLEITHSSITDNRAQYGGGLQLDFGNVLIRDSTISGNRAGAVGGGVRTEFTRLEIYHTTITNNLAALVGGGLAYGSTIVLSHTILAGNSAPTGPDLGQATSLGGTITARFSLIGDRIGNVLVESPIGSPDVNGNLIGGPVRGVIDPLLGPLADNGGPTQTHALLVGSSAINAGDPALEPGLGGVPEFDQRGAPFTRLAGSRIDIGAYEVQAAGGALGADFNFDGVVDGGDFLAWQRGLGRTSATIRHGDATADGDVDGNDLAVWKSRFDQTGNVASLTASSGAASIGLDSRTDRVELARAWDAFAAEPVSDRRVQEEAADVVFTATLPSRPWYSPMPRDARWTHRQAGLAAIDVAGSPESAGQTDELADDAIDEAFALDGAATSVRFPDRSMSPFRGS